MKIVVVVVDGHGGIVEVVLDVGKVPGGNVVGEMVTTAVVGHGPMPAPGSGQSRCVEVVVFDGTVVVVVGVQPNLARNGANAWRTKSLAPKSALTTSSAWQMRAWKIELIGGTWAWAACTWVTAATTPISSTVHRRN